LAGEFGSSRRALPASSEGSDSFAGGGNDLSGQNAQATPLKGGTMPTVPESDLQQVLSRLIDATTKNTSARKTAVRWFNRLYYDVRRWNESFIGFLKTYPGFASSMLPTEYKNFLGRLGEYRDSLQERYGTVKNDLCTGLKILSARYSQDFAWLYKEDEPLYHEIRSLIDESYATEIQIIRVAYSVADFIYGISSDEDWHVQHHDEIANRIRDYEEASKQAVANLQQMAESAGISLLDISEYETILNNEGSANPNVMVIGEITMSQDNINIKDVVGPVNVKARLDHVTQNVNTASTFTDVQKQEFSAIIEELKQALASAASVAKPEDTQRVTQVAEMVAAEVKKEEPNKSFLTISTEGLMEAAKAVEAVAPAVLRVAAKIAAFVAGI
jgi:chaperonin cofactor prefoldin